MPRGLSAERISRPSIIRWHSAHRRRRRALKASANGAQMPLQTRSPQPLEVAHVAHITGKRTVFEEPSLSLPLLVLRLLLLRPAPSGRRMGLLVFPPRPSARQKHPVSTHRYPNHPLFQLNFFLDDRHRRAFQAAALQVPLAELMVHRQAWQPRAGVGWEGRRHEVIRRPQRGLHQRERHLQGGAERCYFRRKEVA